MAYIQRVFGVQIAHMTLWKYYKRHQIKFKTVDLYSTRKLIRAEELR